MERRIVDARLEPLAADDLLAVVDGSAARGPLWTHQSADLNVNPVALPRARAEKRQRGRRWLQGQNGHG